jgi:hypothetical protein
VATAPGYHLRAGAPTATCQILDRHTDSEGR